MITNYNTYIKESKTELLDITFHIESYNFNTSSTKRNFSISTRGDNTKVNKIYELLKKYEFIYENYFNINKIYKYMNRNSLLFILYQIQKEFDNLKYLGFRNYKGEYVGFKTVSSYFEIEIPLNVMIDILSKVDFNINIFQFKKLIEKDINENPNLIFDKIVNMFLTPKLKNKYSHLYNAKNFDLI